MLDPRRHFKKDEKKSHVPEFSHLGTVIEGPTEFYSARLPRRERSQNLLTGLLSDGTAKHHFKSKFRELQASKFHRKKSYSRLRRTKATRFHR